MKKLLFSMACMTGAMLASAAFTSCDNDSDAGVVIYDSTYAGIYTSTSAADTSTVILMPQGQKDQIMIKVRNNDSTECIFLKPMVTLDNVNKAGTFSDKDSGWQGSFSFTEKGNTATFTMVNEKTGQQLPIISLTKEHFGNTLAGNWADQNNPQKNNMSIDLCPMGVPDHGTISMFGTSHKVTVYGPSDKYGKGQMYIDSLGWATYQLSSVESTTSITQSIVITLVDSTVNVTMNRLIGK